jgi:hypothetical protein
MANPEHVTVLEGGVKAWNQWRKDNHVLSPDLSGINLIRADLTGADLSSANLKGSYLVRANLTEANLAGANLTGANLAGANFKRADLSVAHFIRTDLSGAVLTGANLYGTNLSSAHLVGATLNSTRFYSAVVNGANFARSKLGNSSFGNMDMQEANGLEEVIHSGPSTIGIDTLYLSKGRLPDVFLRGCGVPEDFIAYTPALIGAVQVIQFYSCFISFSTRDEDFAKRLHARMRQEKLRVWFAPEDMKGGEKLNQQIETAILVNDRLLLVLSEESMRSSWVTNEIKKARHIEKTQSRRKLFPIRLVSYETIKDWDRINPDIDIEVAEEVQTYFIPDFSQWKDHDAFEKTFARLLRDLRAEEKK